MFCVLGEESILVGLNRGFDSWINFGKWLGIYLSTKNGKTLQVNNILFIRCSRNKITVCSGIPNNFTLLFIVRHWWLPFLMLCLLNSWQKYIFSCLFWYSFYKQWFSQKGKSFHLYYWDWCNTLCSPNSISFFLATLDNHIFQSFCSQVGLPIYHERLFGYRKGSF